MKRDALGLGLRKAHYAAIFADWPTVDYFEIITENFIGEGAYWPRDILSRIRERYPVVLHGVGLNLLGPAPPSNEYLDAVATLAEDVNAPFVTDHLCWTSSGAHHTHDLLPTPYTEDVVAMAVERAARVQRHLGRPFGLENLSSYIAFERSTMTEWDFFAAIVEGAGCGYLLDLNNVVVSAHNHRFSAVDYLDVIDGERVLQFHLAGPSHGPDGLLIDTHDHPVEPATWALYGEAVRRWGPRPTLLEWDAAIPPLDVVVRELDRAREHHP